MSYMTVDLSQDDLQRATTLINLVKSQEASNDAFLLLDPLEYVCEKERKKLTEEQARPGRNEESPDSMFHSKFLAHGHMHMGRMNLLWCKLPAACRESPCKDAVLIYQWLSSLVSEYLFLLIKDCIYVGSCRSMNQTRRLNALSTYRNTQKTICLDQNLSVQIQRCREFLNLFWDGKRYALWQADRKSSKYSERQTTFVFDGFSQDVRLFYFRQDWSSLWRKRVIFNAISKICKICNSKVGQIWLTSRSLFQKYGVHDKICCFDLRFKLVWKCNKDNHLWELYQPIKRKGNFANLMK